MEKGYDWGRLSDELVIVRMLGVADFRCQTPQGRTRQSASSLQGSSQEGQCLRVTTHYSLDPTRLDGSNESRMIPFGWLVGILLGMIYSLGTPYLRTWVLFAPDDLTGETGEITRKVLTDGLTD